jgi:hypothetical protein
MQSNVVCLVLSSDTLDDQAKELILSVTKDVVNLQDETVDSRAEGPNRDWVGLHLGVWNKYAWKVST